MYLDGLPQGEEAKNFKGKKLDHTVFEKVCWICFFLVQGLLMLDGPGRCQANSWDNFTSSCMLPRMCGNRYLKSQIRNVGLRNDMVYQVNFLGSS